MEAQVESLIWKSENIFSLELEIKEKINALPGQFILVSIDNIEKRAYSIISNENNKIKLGIKVGKEISKELSQLEPGDKIKIEGPFGSFIPRKANRVSLIAGGIGITPLISIYKYYHKEGIEVEVLISSNDEFVFLEEFNSPKLFNTKNSRQINAKDIMKDSLIYLCGPEAMINSLRKQLIENGHDEENILSEEFN